MATWFWCAVVAAVLYGAHQIFTRLAADHIGDGLGGFVVESIAALTILLYLAALWFGGRWNQKFSRPSLNLVPNEKRRRRDHDGASAGQRSP